MTVFGILGACFSIHLGTAPLSLAPSPSPGVPSPDLEYFTVVPGSTTTYSLLVVPVVFPGEDTLGSGGVEGITQKLSDASVNGLKGYFLAATYNHVDVDASLTNIVMADNPRTFYTSDGDGNFGFGTDPNAYPHNARFLVEEVVVKLAGKVDFRQFDNTGDGICDGLLLLHSGPPAPETGEGITPDDMLAHAFTLESPLHIHDGVVFPYAIASSFDALGPWAHETAHLWGLPDLYVNNPLAPSPGVGEWSLMATGALSGQGHTPSGLDVTSLHKLGFPADSQVGAALDVSAGAMARHFSSNQSSGDVYFLVGRNDGSNGLFVPRPATQVYLVDNRIPDNRNPNRPHVELRALVCNRIGSCNAALDDLTSPSLNDPLGEPTGLRMEFSESSVTAVYPGQEPLLTAIRLGSENDETRPLILTFENSTASALAVAYRGFPATAGWSFSDDEITIQVPPQQTSVDSSLILDYRNGADTGSIELEWELAISEGVRSPLGSERFALAPGKTGLTSSDLGSFEVLNLSPGRGNPWSWRDSLWIGEGPPILSDTGLDSPWFLVPVSGTLVFDSSWSLDAVAPQTALDGAQIRLLTQMNGERVLVPPGGLGYQAERGTGNTLGGMEVLSGQGNRRTVISLKEYAGETVQVRFRMAGDAVESEGVWRLEHVSAASAPDCSVGLSLDLSETIQITLTPQEENCALDYILYGGPYPAPPSRIVSQGNLASPVAVEDKASLPGNRMRYDVVWWSDERSNQSSASGVGRASSEGPSVLAEPNPSRGSGQLWSVDIPEEGPLGSYCFVLTSVTGRRVASIDAVFNESGRRSVVWSGLDQTGRRAARGVYWLSVHSPSGTSGTVQIVVLP